MPELPEVETFVRILGEGHPGHPAIVGRAIPSSSRAATGASLDASVKLASPLSEFWRNVPANARQEHFEAV